MTFIGPTPPRFVYRSRGYSSDELRRARAACRDAPTICAPEPRDDEDDESEYLTDDRPRRRRRSVARPQASPAVLRILSVALAECMRRRMAAAAAQARRRAEAPPAWWGPYGRTGRIDTRAGWGADLRGDQ